MQRRKIYHPHRFAVWIVTAFFTIAGQSAVYGQSYDISSAIFSLVDGTWELDPSETKDRGSFVCAERPLTISISDDRQTYTAWHGNGENKSPLISATIIESTASYILLQYGNETRLDDDGAPVKWYLHIAGANSFFWIRSDWLDLEGTSRTMLRRRCPADELAS